MNRTFPNGEAPEEADFFRLMSGLCDGCASDDERARLERYVLSSEAAQQRYLQYVHLHAALFRHGLAGCPPPGVGSRAWLAQLTDSEGASAVHAPGTPAQSNRLSVDADPVRSPIMGFLRTAVDLSMAWISSPKALALAVAGSLATYFVGLMISLSLTRGLVERDPAGAPDHSPARVIGTSACRWQDRATALEAGSKLPDGMSRLASGVVELEFTGGARVRIEGPAEFKPQSGGRIGLGRGRLLATVPRQARGFTVDTPTAEVIDLGTEFGVEVDGQGSTDLHVIRGRVEVKAVSADGVEPRVERIVAGQAIRVSANGAKPERIALDRDRFTGVRSAAITAVAPSAQAAQSFSEKQPIWLGNLFDDGPHTSLADAVRSDRFRAEPDSFKSLGVHRVVYGGQPVQEIAFGLRFDLTNLGWESLAPNGLRIANDAWADVVEIASSQTVSLARQAPIYVGDSENVLAGAGRRITTSTAFNGYLGQSSALIDDQAQNAVHDGPFLFGSGDKQQRLSITGFEAPLGFRTLRLFSVAHDATRRIETVTAYSSCSATSSLNADDYETKLGTFSAADRVYQPFLIDTKADARGYFDLSVAAPAGTQSLLLDFGPVGGSTSGIRLHEIQALAGKAAPLELRDQIGQGGGIRLDGAQAGLSAPRMEEGIGMHANALLTFDLDDIRAAGGLSGRALEFVCDRSGINDAALSSGKAAGSVHMLVLVSSQAEVRSAVVDGRAVELVHSDGNWSVKSALGKPLVPGGRVATWRVPVAADAKYLTLASTSAGDGDYRDQAVWVGARLEMVPVRRQKAQKVKDDSSR